MADKNDNLNKVNGSNLRNQLSKKQTNPNSVPSAISNLNKNKLNNLSQRNRVNNQSKQMDQGNQQTDEFGEPIGQDASRSAASQIAGTAKKVIDLATSKSPIDLIKKKIILYVAASAGSFLIVLIMIIAVIGLIIGPIQAVMDVVNGVAGTIDEVGQRFGNFFSFKGFNTDKETFYNALNERYAFYYERGAIIDVPLIVSTLFVDRSFDENADYECNLGDKEACDVNEDGDYAIMRNDAIELANNMVYKSGKQYFCNINTTVPNENNPDGYELVTKTTSCGTDKKNCKCSSWEISEEPTYALQSEDYFKTYLYNIYLPNKVNIKLINEFNLKNPQCVAPEYSDKDFCSSSLTEYLATIDNDKVVKKQIDTIYEKRDIYLEFAEDMGLMSTGKSYGDSINSIGINWNMPSDLRSYLANPLGDGACRQSSCFGTYYYSSDKQDKLGCAYHSAVDLTSPGTSNAKIYSVAEGVVQRVSDDTRVCTPGSSCPGRSITIRHTININGKDYDIVSAYRHLASFADPTLPLKIKNGEEVKVSKGQFIGIMGKTGNVTGVHLHIEVFEAGSKNAYDVSQINAISGCNLIANCSGQYNRCSSENRLHSLR